MSKGVIGVSAAEQGRYTSFWASYSGMYKPDHIAVFPTSSNIAENRNTITQVMLDSGADWVFYLDDDHILPQDILIRLLEADKPIISAHYTQRQPPFGPVLMQYELPTGGFLKKFLSPNETGIIEVAAVGSGCLLVKREVIEALQPPYWTLGQLNPASWGDDLHFCSRVRAAGFPIYCDLGATIGHTMSGVVWPAHVEGKGWVANFGRDPQDPPIAQWPMPMSDI